MNSFASERQLVDCFTEYLKQCLPSHSTRIFHEFESRNGIADLVLASLPNSATASSSIGRHNPRWIAAIAAIDHRLEFSAEIFSELTGLPLKTARNALKAFNLEGYVRLIGNNLYSKTSVLKPLVDELCAIEAKLRNWQKALLQAYRYQDFATQSWVLLDSRYVGAALISIGEFKKLNVGLASMGTDKQVHIYFEPMFKMPRIEERFWLANCLIARSVSNNIIH